MFDIGFVEIVTISVVALLVLGPDKLPGAIRTAGLWIGRLRRSFNNIKADIEREVGADEIRRQLRNEEIMERIKSTRAQFSESVDSVKKEAESVKKDLSMEDELSSLTGKGASTSGGKNGETGNANQTGATADGTGDRQQADQVGAPDESQAAQPTQDGEDTPRPATPHPAVQPVDNPPPAQGEGVPAGGGEGGESGDSAAAARDDSQDDNPPEQK